MKYLALLLTLIASPVLAGQDYIPPAEDMVMSWVNAKKDQVKCTIYDIDPEFQKHNTVVQRKAYDKFLTQCSARQAAEEIPADKR